MGNVGVTFKIITSIKVRIISNESFYIKAKNIFNQIDKGMV